MPNVFVEPTADGRYQIEFAGSEKTMAKRDGHHPLVARVRHLNDKSKPDQWREAE